MKANKIFAVALAALALVACNKTPEPEQTKLALNETEIKVQVDATFQLTANLAVTWASSNDAVATVTPANDGKSAQVKGIAAGEANITATATDGQKAVCKVTVEGGTTPPPAGGDYADFKQLQGSAYYVFFLQSGATKYLGNKVLYNFGPNDNAGQGSRWLYVWAGTFTGGTAIGTDPFDMQEGWTSLVQGTAGWAGAGLCVAINDQNNTSGEGVAEDLAALNDLKKNITNYDEWYLAVALKNSVQGAGYEFNLIGSNVFDPTKIDQDHPNGQGVESGVGTINIAPKATGEWVYLEYKLADIPGLEFGEFTTNGSNILTFLGVPYMAGTQLDLGYAFIYKK